MSASCSVSSDVYLLLYRVVRGRDARSRPVLGKVTFKVMHYNIAFLYEKVTNSITFYGKYCIPLLLHYLLSPGLGLLFF